MANMYKSVLASGVQPTGNATVSDVLAGKTFSNADGVGKVGTMVNNGAVSGTATPNQPYTIPAGYHNGEGTVSASGDYPLGANKYLELKNDGGVTESTFVDGTPFGATTSNALYYYIIDVSDKTTATINEQYRYRKAITKSGELVSINGGSITVDISNYKLLIIGLFATSTIGTEKITIS